MTGGAFAPAGAGVADERAAQHARGPWMLVIAVLVLVAGFGWLALFSASWRLEPPPGADSKVTHPPDRRCPSASRRGSPARRRRRRRWRCCSTRPARHRVDRRGAGRGGPRAGHIHRAHEGHAASLPAHERTLLDIAFEGGSGLRHAPLTQVRNRLATRLTPFAAAMRRRDAAARAARPRARDRAKRTLARALVVATMLAVSAASAPPSWLAPAFGPWAAAVPLAACSSSSASRSRTAASPC
jgi:hypothetical protein